MTDKVQPLTAESRDLLAFMEAMVKQFPLTAETGTGDYLTDLYDGEWAATTDRWDEDTVPQWQATGDVGRGPTPAAALRALAAALREAVK